MTRAEIAKKIADVTGIKLYDADKAVETVIGCIGNALINKDDVVLKGLGVFRVYLGSPRRARNIHDNSIVDISPQYRVRFKPSKNIKAELLKVEEN